MKNRDMEAILARYKKEIPVNHQLKRSLRKSFAVPHGSGLSRFVLFRKAGFAAAISLVLCAALMIPGLFNQAPKVSAAELQVNDYISLVNVGSSQSVGIGEYNGVVYLAVPGEGIYAYDREGYRRVFEMDADHVGVSPDGEMLVLSKGGSLYILDIKTGDMAELLKGNEDSGIYYEDPNWSPDGKKIIFVKKVIEFRDTHGFDVKDSGIYEISLDGGSPVRLAEGSSPSYITGTDYILYEDQHTIVLMDLKKGSTKTVDNGRFPSVSPDGKMIAYVKTERTIREIAENVQVEEALGNIWIADTTDTDVRKRVTENYPYYFIDEEEWLNSLDSSEMPQVLSYSGQFEYYHPVWSSDSRSLFALRNAAGGSQASGMKLIRIQLGQNISGSEETVKKYLQALIRRDEDYAKSLLSFKTELPLSVSNPHPSGYRILSASCENGKAYVEAEMELQYTANPYHQIIGYRFELTKTEEGYRINKIAETKNIEVLEQNGTIFVITGGQRKDILKIKDIPEKYTEGGYSCRLASLIYLENSNKLVMSVQQMNETGQSISAALLCYNLSNGSLELLDKIEAENGSAGVSGLSVDPEGKYLAADIEITNGDELTGTVYVYNLADKSRTALDTLLKDADVDSVHSLYWSDEGLIFEALKDGRAVRYIYKPKNGTAVQTIMSSDFAEPL